MRRRSGFTLVELLVVISIIALLISILLPSLGKARKQTRAVVCLSNMRSLMIAAQMYGQDNRGQLPSAGLTHGGQADEVEKSWLTQLAQSYGRSEKVVRCPEDRSKHWREPLADGRLRRTSYGSNGYTVYPVGGKEPYDRIDRIKRPTETIFLVELAKEGSFAASDHVDPQGWWWNPPVAAREQMQIDQHLGRANYALIDGHAETLPFERTYKLRGGFPPVFVRNMYDPGFVP